MATLTENGQSYLEEEAIAARHEQMGRSDYNPNNEYSAQHKDALATGDERGKGTGDFGGHGFIVPDMSKPRNQRSGMFNTENAGNDCDHSARKIMTERSIYGPGREYGVEYVVNTSANRAEGQYDGSERTRIPYKCPLL